MPSMHFGSLKPVLVLTIWLATITTAPPRIDAQSATTWSAGGSLGLAPSVGGWRAELDPGTEYRVSVVRGRLGSRWALDAELARHSFSFSDEALVGRNAVGGRGFIRQTSLGFGLRYALFEHSLLSAWTSGGIAAHSVRTSIWRDHQVASPMLLRDEYVPGVTAGLGLAVGPFRIKPVAEVRLRVVALRERPLISVPIAVGLRF